MASLRNIKPPARYAIPIFKRCHSLRCVNGRRFVSIPATRGHLCLILSIIGTDLTYKFFPFADLVYKIPSDER